MTNFTAQCDSYLDQRSGCYEYRSVRYMEAVKALQNWQINDNDTVLDLGAGWTEFDYTLRTAADWRGRYIPVDGGIDGTDLNVWQPPRRYDFVVALEILEHLNSPSRMIHKLQDASSGIVVSVPNPRTVDVLGIDPTHVSIVTPELLEFEGFTVREATFYGGVFSNGAPDSLFATWKA